MRPDSPRHVHRRAIFINPRFQVGVALCFAAVVIAASALFGWSFHRYAKHALRVASLQGHYHFTTPYEILGGALVRNVAALTAAGLASGIVVFLLILRRVRGGVGRLIDAFRRSAEGDLSTPTEARGILDVTDLGRKIDASRARTLSLICEAREEAEILRKEPLSDEDFARRWDALKQTLQRIAP